LPDQFALFADALALPEGLRYTADFIPEAVERDLIDHVAALPLQPFQFGRYEGKRRIASFGWRYDYSQRRLLPAEPVPGWLAPLIEQVEAFGGPGTRIDQILCTEYEAGVGDEEAMQVEVEAILDRRAIDLGNHPACARQRTGVEARTLAEQHQFVWRAAGVASATAADVDSELLLKRPETALQSADHAGGDARGVPVHSHHGAERLEPEGVRQPLEEFVAAVVMDDCLRDDGPEAGHALGEPRGDASTMQREIGASGPPRHQLVLSSALKGERLSLSFRVRSVIE
jgi:hypothetical protein